MFQDAFKKLDKTETEILLRDINPALDGMIFPPGLTTILAHGLPFYPGYLFLDIGNYEVNPPVRRFVVYKAGDVTVLDWTNEPVYALNQRVPLTLDEETVQAYVKFFFSYIKGRHGRFILVETVDDIPWKEDPPAAARKAIGQMMTALEVKDKNPDGSYKLSVCMVFKDSLFRTDVKVAAGGQVSMEKEELLIENMPVMDDIFGQ